MNTTITPPAPRRYSPLQTVLITLAVFFGSQLIGGVLISLIPLLLGHSQTQTSAWLDTVWTQFIFVAIVEGVTVRFLWEFMRRRGISFKSLGLNKPRFEHIGYALSGYAAYFVSYLIVIGVFSALLPGFNVEQEQQLGFSKSAAGIELVPIFISLVILPPLVEEIVARGFLFRGLRSKLPFVSAMLITSGLFAAAHLPEASDGLLWVAAVDTFILSVVMCYLREKTGSLWPSVGVHFLKNGLAFIILFNIAQYFR